VGDFKMQNFIYSFDPILIISAGASLFIFAVLYFANQYFNDNKSRSNVKKRLHAKAPKNSQLDKSKEQKNKSSDKKLSNKVAKKANDFYASSDPINLKKMRMQLMQAGYMQPGAVGQFIAARFASGIAGAALGLLIAIFLYADETLTYKICVILFLGVIGYFIPNFYIGKRAKTIEQSNRQGFPDILDLMVVSAEAGLTMEASIERISTEIKHTYPHLSVQLNMAALEIRAGRPIDQALRSFGERLRLDEVKGFATMVQQAKELGTSVSDALRVYSEEMRHKRMMMAEEKAYALPAKMSVPVTLFILPIVIGIAIVPTIVRFNM